MTHRDVFETKKDNFIDEIVEDMRQRIADRQPFGVTVSGNRLTMRWNDKNNLLRQAHMVIVCVETEFEPNEEEDEK